MIIPEFLLIASTYKKAPDGIFLRMIFFLTIMLEQAKLLVDMLLRIDKKLCTGGVDDSNGTVGGFMQETVSVLEEYVELDPNCIKAFEKLCGQSTCFDWEEPI